MRSLQVCVLFVLSTATQAFAGWHDQPQPTEFRFEQRVVGTFPAQSAISKRVFDWQRSLPTRRFKIDMNSYAPQWRIYVGKDSWIQLGSDGKIVLSKPGLLGETQRSAKFLDGDPVLEQLREIFADAQEQAESELGRVPRTK